MGIEVFDDIFDGVAVNINRSLSTIWKNTRVSEGSQRCERKCSSNGGFELCLKALSFNNLGTTYLSSLVCNKAKMFFFFFSPRKRSTGVLKCRLVV